MYLYTNNEVSKSRLLKVGAITEQTDTVTERDRFDRTHYDAAFVDS